MSSFFVRNYVVGGSCWLPLIEEVFGRLERNRRMPMQLHECRYLNDIRESFAVINNKCVSWLVASLNVPPYLGTERDFFHPNR